MFGRLSSLKMTLYEIYQNASQIVIMLKVILSLNQNLVDLNKIINVV